MKKQPGQVAFEAKTGGGPKLWDIEPGWSKNEYAAAEAAVLAAYQPERPAGVWVLPSLWIALAHVRSLERVSSSNEWRVCVQEESNLFLDDEAAKPLVEALGGEWPTEDPK